MEPRHVLAIQALFNLVSYAIVLRAFVWPRLRGLPRVAALQPLVAFHFVRTLGLFALYPAMTSERVAASRWAHHVAAGDALTVALAWAAVLALRTKPRLGGALAWAMNTVGTLDVLNAGRNAAAERIVDGPIGPHALVLAFGVPALVVTHVAIYGVLLRREPVRTLAPPPRVTLVRRPRRPA